MLSGHGDMGVCWLDAGQQWSHGRALASNEYIAFVCADWVLASNGNMCVCLFVVDQHWRHVCVLAGC